MSPGLSPMQTSVSPGRRLSTRLLTGLYGSFAARSFVVLLLFFNLGVDGALFGVGDSRAELSSMWSGSFEICRFLLRGVVLGVLVAVFGEDLMYIRGDRRGLSFWARDEYSNDLRRSLKDAATSSAWTYVQGRSLTHFGRVLARLNTCEPTIRRSGHQIVNSVMFQASRLSVKCKAGPKEQTGSVWERKPA